VAKKIAFKKQEMGYSIQTPYERLNKNDKAFTKRFRVVIKIDLYTKKA
jgi:hypothetical protein